MSVADARWYVVYTHSQAEGRAAFNLRRQGFQVYLPRYLKNRRHARRVESVAAPLFPRYLFVQLDLQAQQWGSIRSTVGVVHLVARGHEPTAVPAGIVEGIRARESEEGLVTLGPATAFRPGSSVRIVEGPFADAVGLFEAASDGHRVAILLDLLGRRVRVLISEDVVVAA
jgi:transcriptional antiterminator RfaH